MTNIKEDQSTNEKIIKITVADNVGHQTGPDNMYIQKEQSIVETAKRMDVMRECPSIKTN